MCITGRSLTPNKILHLISTLIPGPPGSNSSTQTFISSRLKLKGSSFTFQGDKALFWCSPEAAARILYNPKGLEIQFTLIFKGWKRISVTVSVYVVVALRLSSSRVSAVVVVDRGGSPYCLCATRRTRRAAAAPRDGTPAPAGLVSLCTAARCTRPPLLLSQVSQVTCKCNATTHYYDYPKAPLTTNLMIVVFEN